MFINPTEEKPADHALNLFTYLQLVHSTKRYGLLLVRLDSELGFHVIDLFALAIVVKRLLHFRLLVVKNDQIAVAHVEARQVIHGVLGVVNILVHHEGSSTSVLLVSPVIGADKIEDCKKTTHKRAGI